MKIYYKLSQVVPILGIVQSRLSDGRATVQLTSFGRNTKQLHDYTFFPTFIDFSNMKRIKYEDFSIKYPATWRFELHKIKTRKFYICQIGGNIHATTMFAEIYKGKPKEILKKYLKYIKTKGSISLDFYKKMD